MPQSNKYELTHNAHGKHHVRVSKIKRPRKAAPKEERHDFVEASVDVVLEGDLDTSYTDGDNGPVVATDTCKNTVYCIAKDDTWDSIESLGVAIAEHFVKQYDHIDRVTVHLREQRWHRLLDCDHAFTGSDGETPLAEVIATRGKPTQVTAGLTNLVIAKTTETGFTDFHRDEFRTLGDTEDRILATELTANWQYVDSAADFSSRREAIRTAMLRRFIDHYSVSVQETLYFMGQAALDTCAEANSITLTMPNKHHLLANLEPFNRENENEIFVSTDEPFGYITATLTRSDS